MVPNCAKHLNCQNITDKGGVVVRISVGRLNDLNSETFWRQFHKMVKHTQTIRRQFTEELFECV